MSNIKKMLKSFIRKATRGEMMNDIHSFRLSNKQKSSEYLEWVGANIVGFVNEFTDQSRILDSLFVKRINKAFNTGRFDVLFKKWLSEYSYGLFGVLDDLSGQNDQTGGKVVLEDNPLNRFLVEKYQLRFKPLMGISWKTKPALRLNIINLIKLLFGITVISLRSGVRFNLKLKEYKVMREALWGLYDVGGRYFHDDFFVDEKTIKAEDLLLFTRGTPVEGGRVKACHDAKHSPYTHFTLGSLPLGLKDLILRVIPNYFISSLSLFPEVVLENYSLYYNVWADFVRVALPYEKTFSNFSVSCELGHGYSSAFHVAESIVCQSHGVKYYLMHWSDQSMPISGFIMFFTGCDGFFVWGKAHTHWMGEEARVALPIGYMFKRFIGKVASNREKVLAEMGVIPRGKIVSFFEETFGTNCKMTEENFVEYWETLLKFAEQRPDLTILVKPKALERHENLSPELKRRFLGIKARVDSLPNVNFVDSDKWSFIEVIGVSDLVVTHGMTSSATIAIICGIPGIYFDNAHYEHPFSTIFKHKLVFDSQGEVLSMLNKIVDGAENPLKEIPENILREYDAFSDDRGIDLFRSILAGEK